MKIHYIEGQMTNAGDKIIIHADIEKEDVTPRGISFIHIVVDKSQIHPGYPMIVGGCGKQG